MSLRHIALLAVAALPAIGCYQYRLATPGQVDPGADLKAHLAEPRDVALTDITVRGAVLVEGTLLTWGADSVEVSALAVESRTGSRHRAVGEVIRIPVGQVNHLEARRIAWGPTGAVLGGIGAGIAGIVALIAGGEKEVGGGGNGGGGGQPR